jgi:hypothetical protein
MLPGLEPNMCGQAHVRLNIRRRTDEKTQRSCDTLVSEWTPNESTDHAPRRDARS